MSSGFYPIPTKFIFDFKGPLPFDVFIERFKGKFSKIYNKYDEHDPEQLYRYEMKKIKNLYITMEEKDIYGQFFCSVLEQINNTSKDIDKECLIEVIQTTLEFTYEKIIFDNDEFESNLSWANQQVKSSLKLLENDFKSALEIFKAIAQNKQLLKHSYMVSLFSLMLAKKLGFTNQKALMTIGLGALLHDVGQSRINNELFQKPFLSPKEWDEIKDHPHLGLKIVDHSKGIPSEVRSIIIQHHEHYNGRGYPNRLTNAQIFPLAKIVAIADGFCSFVSKTSYRETIFNPEQAISMMKEDIGHYDPEYLQVFEEMIFNRKEKHLAH